MSEWVTWRGGDCPIKSNLTTFRVLYRDNEIEHCETGHARDTFRWDHQNVGSDIVAYLICDDREVKTEARTIHLNIVFGSDECDDCGFYEFGYIASELAEHRYCTHMGPSLPTPIDELGSPYNSNSYMQGYAQAIVDLGYNVTYRITDNDD